MINLFQTGLDRDAEQEAQRYRNMRVLPVPTPPLQITDFLGIVSFSTSTVCTGGQTLG